MPSAEHGELQEADAIAHPTETSASSTPVDESESTETDKKEPAHTLPHASPIAGLLNTQNVNITHANGVASVARPDRVYLIPFWAIGFIDLANSGDFAANVFNEIPVPIYATVLMVLGGVFALVMSIVAFYDARHSLRNIQLMREERQRLRRGVGSDEEKADMTGQANALLELNTRDIRTELFDRAGMELTMGTAAFVVSVGCFLAPGGANTRVFQASNLLSGYIGNAPAAFYGLINALWSIMAWTRARRHRRRAMSCLQPGSIRDAFMRRNLLVRLHAIASGLSALVSGSLGMVTPTHWWPYPVLLVCGIVFFWGTWEYKQKIGYQRAVLNEFDELQVTTHAILQEIEFLNHVRKNHLKKDLAVVGTVITSQPVMATHAQLAMNVGTVVRLDLFEQLCIKAVLNKQFLAELHAFDRPKQTEMSLTPQHFFSVGEGTLSQVLQLAQECLQAVTERDLHLREQYLLEMLGCCLTSG